MKNFVIFDFDGTLVDTITDVAICFNEALRRHGFAEHPLKAFDNFVGGNLETVVGRMLPDADRTQANIDAVKITYRQLYLESPKEHTKPYPGIYALLQALDAAGIRYAVNTNKAQALTDALMQSQFSEFAFTGVAGYREDAPSKPDPHGVNLLLRQAGAAREQAVYVGDGKSDIDTAENAGIPCILATWGQTRPEDLMDARVAFQAENAAAVVTYLTHTNAAVQGRGNL